MCTVTWWRDPAAGAFGVWFNRDERRTRPASEPVRAHAAAEDGTRFLAPRDPAAGGTWLLANVHGLVVGVLNFYAAEPAETRPRVSRGTLPWRHAARRSVAEVAGAMQTLACGDYAPFVLLAWDRGGEAGWSWDGATLQQEALLQPPISTSSYRSREIVAWRKSRYAQLVVQAEAATLTKYHDDVAHANPAFNVRMRRPDARTESVCRVTMTPAEVSFWHRREAPGAVAALDVQEARIACAG
jgi:hypothetical protein